MLQAAAQTGTTVAYDDQGSGEPALLLMPGWCMDRQMFSRLAPLLASGHRVLALDWRGHGDSPSSGFDFGSHDLVDDAMAVIESAGAHHIVPVAVSHAGWVAIELQRRLAERMRSLVLIDWPVTAPPAPLAEALQLLQDPFRWEAARDSLFDAWAAGESPEVAQYLEQRRERHGLGMWSRAGREIAGGYARLHTPLEALAALGVPPRVLHLYAQPAGPEFLEAQRSFAASHPWFAVERLEGRSHFPHIETPVEVSQAIERFVSLA